MEIKKIYWKDLNRKWDWKVVVFQTPTSLLARLEISSAYSTKFVSKEDAVRDCESALLMLGLNKLPITEL